VKLTNSLISKLVLVLALRMAVSIVHPAIARANDMGDCMMAGFDVCDQTSPDDLDCDNEAEMHCHE
jgi:hypothetical protein